MIDFQVTSYLDSILRMSMSIWINHTVIEMCSLPLHWVRFSLTTFSWMVFDTVPFLTFPFSFLWPANPLAMHQPRPRSALFSSSLFCIGNDTCSLMHSHPHQVHVIRTAQNHSPIGWRGEGTPRLESNGLRALHAALELPCIWKSKVAKTPIGQ